MPFEQSSPLFWHISPSFEFEITVNVDAEIKVPANTCTELIKALDADNFLRKNIG